jgi:hypothetical protein
MWEQAATLWRATTIAIYYRGVSPAKEKRITMTNHTKPRVTSFAPQFLVDDLERSVAYYQRLGFSFGEPWGGFYDSLLRATVVLLNDSGATALESHNRKPDPGCGFLRGQFLNENQLPRFVDSCCVRDRAVYGSG